MEWRGACVALALVAALLCTPRCDGRKTVIPTVVRKSANTEGMVCLLVSRGISPLHLVASESFPARKFQRRNSRRGIPHPSKSLANLEKQLPDLREGDSALHQAAVQDDRQDEGMSLGDVASSDPSGHSLAQNLELNVAVGGGVPHPSEANTAHQEGSGAVIQEDRIYHVPPDVLPSSNRHVHEKHASSSGATHTHEASEDEDLLELLTEKVSRHDLQERSSKARQFPLLRPLRPEDSRNVVQRQRPLVKVSLLVKAASGNLQFEAGEVVVEDRYLEEGMHTLRFQHLVEGGKHRLSVALDGHLGHFESSKRPLPPSEFEFHEVWIKIQGPVTFVANNSCESEPDDSGHDTPAQPTNTLPSLDEGEDAVPTDGPAETEGTPASPVLPLKAIVNAIVHKRTLTHKVVMNSTVSDASLSLSYISNSTLVNTAIDNSIVINTIVRNSTLVNSTLQDVHLINCEVINSRTVHSKTENTKFVRLQPLYNTSQDFGFDPLQDEITFEDYDGAPALDSTNASGAQGLNITMMVFGVLGLVVLVLVMVGMVLLVARHIIKKRKEMLLVRSAVMGSVKSW